jgi:hypothetical protein
MVIPSMKVITLIYSLMAVNPLENCREFGKKMMVLNNTDGIIE